MKNLERFLNEKYKDYQYGNPQKAAQNLINNLKEIEKILNDSKGQVDLAGSFLAPGMSDSFLKDLNNMILRVEDEDEAEGDDWGDGNVLYDADEVAEYEDYHSTLH